MKDNKRRRIFYIDKIFQKKLLMLFLGLNLLIVGANILYYFVHLKGAVEDNLFRSHIVLDNISQVLAGDVIRFNILLAVSAVVLVLLFYTLTRVRLQLFFNRTRDALTARRERTSHEAGTIKIQEEFQEIDQVLNRFFHRIDTQLEQENQKVEQIKEKFRTS